MLPDEIYSPSPHEPCNRGYGGSAPLINDWFRFVNGSIIATDVDSLNLYAPTLLRNATAQSQGTDFTSTTLYHFGYSTTRNRYVGFAYRSTKNWEPDQLPDALGFKPVVDVRPTEKIEFPQFFIDIISLNNAERTFSFRLRSEWE